MLFQKNSTKPPWHVQDDVKEMIIIFLKPPKKAFRTQNIKEHKSLKRETVGTKKINVKQKNYHSHAVICSFIHLTAFVSWQKHWMNDSLLKLKQHCKIIPSTWWDIWSCQCKLANFAKAWRDKTQSELTISLPHLMLLPLT